MSVAPAHPLARSLREAAHGRFPAPDGRAEVGGPPPGTCDSVAFFVKHIVVAADVTESWVVDQLARQPERAPEDPSTEFGSFLGALSERLGSPPMSAGLLLVAPYRPADLEGVLEPGGEAEPSWAAYHTDVQTHRYRSPSVTGTIAIGRGPGERWDVYLGIEHRESGRGRAGRELLTAAKTVVPERGLLFGTAPLHDPRILRIGLSAGFQVICTEVQFLTRPKGLAGCLAATSRTGCAR